MCHTRELAFQISKEYERFSKYMPTVKTAVFFGGMAIKKDEEVLKKNCPHIVVGTPGRIHALTVTNKTLNLKNLKHFVLDECDKMLEHLGMFRQNVYRHFFSRVVDYTSAVKTSSHRGQFFSDINNYFQFVRHVCATDMRGDVQEIFKATPHEKQVMMFSATLSKDVRPVCRKFMQDVSDQFISISAAASSQLLQL